MVVVIIISVKKGVRQNATMIPGIITNGTRKKARPGSLALPHAIIVNAISASA